MSLSIRELELRDFRSYQEVELSGLGSMSIFVGPNAIGKTNLIEAIQLCTACTSFRSPRPGYLVRFGAEQASARALLSDGDRRLEIELRANELGRSYCLNGKKKTASSLKGILPAILFCPDDLNLVKGSSSVRRDQLDLLGSQVSSSYNSVLRDYTKIVQQKNRYLKEEVTHAYLMAINEVLARVGAQLFMLRARLVDELIPYVAECYRAISSSKDEIRLSYVPSWEQDDAAGEPLGEFDRDTVETRLLDVLAGRFEEEHRRHRSLFGPHADKVYFSINSKDASLFASQGQQRSIVLALKTAEVLLVRDRLNQNPVLLLDDVMSELDENRRHAFMGSIPTEVQTFITATTKDYFSTSSISRADVIDLGSILAESRESNNEGPRSTVDAADNNGSSLAQFKWSGAGAGGAKDV